MIHRTKNEMSILQRYIVILLFPVASFLKQRTIIYASSAEHRFFDHIIEIITIDQYEKVDIKNFVSMKDNYH